MVNLYEANTILNKKLSDRELRLISYYAIFGESITCSNKTVQNALGWGVDKVKAVKSSLVAKKILHEVTGQKMLVKTGRFSTKTFKLKSGYASYYHDQPSQLNEELKQKITDQSAEIERLKAQLKELEELKNEPVAPIEQPLKVEKKPTKAKQQHAEIMTYCRAICERFSPRTKTDSDKFKKHTIYKKIKDLLETETTTIDEVLTGIEIALKNYKENKLKYNHVNALVNFSKWLEAARQTEQIAQPKAGEHTPNYEVKGSRKPFFSARWLKLSRLVRFEIKDVELLNELKPLSKKGKQEDCCVIAEQKYPQLNKEL